MRAACPGFQDWELGRGSWAAPGAWRGGLLVSLSLRGEALYGGRRGGPGYFPWPPPQVWGLLLWIEVGRVADRAGGFREPKIQPRLASQRLRRLWLGAFGKAGSGWEVPGGPAHSSRSSRTAFLKKGAGRRARR